MVLVLVATPWFLDNKLSATQRVYLEPQTNNEGAVTVTVTPENFSDKEWSFDIVLDTHSEELAVDLTKSAALLDYKGNEYAPIDW